MPRQAPHWPGINRGTLAAAAFYSPCRPLGDEFGPASNPGNIRRMAMHGASPTAFDGGRFLGRSRRRLTREVFSSSPSKRRPTVQRRRGGQALESAAASNDKTQWRQPGCCRRKRANSRSRQTFPVQCWRSVCVVAAAWPASGRRRRVLFFLDPRSQYAGVPAISAQSNGKSREFPLIIR